MSENNLTSQHPKEFEFGKTKIILHSVCSGTAELSQTIMDWAIQKALVTANNQ